MKPEIIQAHMATAKNYANLSKARRLKVGAIIVKDDRIVSIGYNGTPPGWDNDCESKDYMSIDAGGWLDPEKIQQRWPFEEINKGEEEPESQSYVRRYALKTKPEVLHAEMNAIGKLAKHGGTSNGADMFCTHAPCVECAKLILVSGIRRVYFGEAYRSTEGVELLTKGGVDVIQA